MTCNGLKHWFRETRLDLSLRCQIRLTRAQREASAICAMTRAPIVAYPSGHHAFVRNSSAVACLSAVRRVGFRAGLPATGKRNQADGGEVPVNERQLCGSHPRSNMWFVGPRSSLTPLPFTAFVGQHTPHAEAMAAHLVRSTALPAIFLFFVCFMLLAVLNVISVRYTHFLLPFFVDS